MKPGFFQISVFLALFLLPFKLHAQVLMDPASVTGGRNRIAPNLTLSEVEYEREFGTTTSIERKVLGFELSHGLGKTIDAVATLGLILDSEATSYSGRGGGMVLGLGGRGVVFRQGASGVVVYGLFNWIQDKFKANGGLRSELQTYDMHFGGTFSTSIEGRFQPYAGIDLALYRDGKERLTTALGSSSVKLEKADILGVKLGINMLLQSVMLRPEVTLVGEETFSFAAGFSF